MKEAAATSPIGYRGVILAWLFLLAFETLAQVTLKAGGQTLSQLPFGADWLITAASSPWVLAGIAGYLGAFAAWMVILDRIPLSLGFPLTAVVMLTVAVASHYIFGEHLSPWRVLGIGLIVAGVVAMGGGDP